MPAARHGKPVFTDLSGRRVRRMRLFGIGASLALLACLIVMAVGLLGGPGASIIPWASGNGDPAGSAPGSAGAAGNGRPGSAQPNPTTMPSPTPISTFGRTPSTRPGSPSGSGSPSPSARSSSSSPSPSSTNLAGKTPPGQNRTPQPTPTKNPRAH
jgi:hypothetical protein